MTKDIEEYNNNENIEVVVELKNEEESNENVVLEDDYEVFQYAKENIDLEVEKESLDIDTDLEIGKNEEEEVQSIVEEVSKKELLMQQLEAISTMESGCIDDIVTALRDLHKTIDNSYHQMIDISSNEDENRVVVVGDIHCDFTSLRILLEKIIKDESFDYINDGYILFLGDYIDRGNSFCKVLAILLQLKKIMGDRCILLKGNHELISYSDGQIRSMVNPSDTAIFLNSNYQQDVEFCRLFVEYITSLPVYCIVSSVDKRFLLVHGGITKDIYMNEGAMIDLNGEIIFKSEVEIELEEQESVVLSVVDGQKKEQYLKHMLYSMMWADPNEYKKKLQSSSSRFEFGSQQFDRFMSISNLDILIRSHEPVREGVESFYDGRLYTIFSSGGDNNADSEYGNPKDMCYVESPKYIVINNQSEIDVVDVYNSKNGELSI